jgi:hypothetical protein
VALRDSIRDKYRGRPIAVVIAISTLALRFALRYREELFADVPIVFFSISAPSAKTTTGTMPFAIKQGPIAG